MSRVIITEGAALGLKRCRQFLTNKSSEALRHAANVIRERFDLLVSQPEIGRPLGDDLDLRELPIEFGDSGYVALYRYDSSADVVYVLAFRHQKEAGY